MTPDDDLSDLRAALDAATPRPGPAVRAAHLRLAQENFERLQAVPSEGPRARVRQGLSAILEGLTGRGTLTAATALVACGFLVLTPVGQDLWQQPFAQGEREAATAAPEPPVTTATEAAPKIAAAEITAAEPTPQVESAPQAAGALRSEPAPVSSEPASKDAAPEVAMTGPAVAPQAESAPGPQVAADARRSEPVSEGRPASPEVAQAVPESAAAGAAMTGPSDAQAESLSPAPEIVASAPAGGPEALEAAPDVSVAQDLAARAAPEARAAPAAVARAAEAVQQQPTVGATAQMASPDTLADETAAALAPPTGAGVSTPAGVATGAPESLAEEARPVDPLPTVAADAEAAYAALREALGEGRLPEGVRIEDLVNRFPYDLAAPDQGPSAAVSVLPTPWNPATRLVVVQIGSALGVQESRTAGEPGVAQDLQAEVDWNPEAVAGHRRIGGETSASQGGLGLEAVTLGSSQQVTRLFEVTPASGVATDDQGLLRLRWTDPASGASRLLEASITGREPAGTEARFAAALAYWGLLLRGEAEGWDEAIALAKAGRGPDPSGRRAEAIDLMRQSQRLAR